MSSVSFLLNGALRTAENISPTTTVLDWLRGPARLTGTKEGCAEGDCGACTIAVGRRRNGSVRYQAVNSCLMLLPQLDGASVITIEGLARDGKLHPVQQALLDTDATQCGFCTPGFAMAMFAFQQGGEPIHDESIHEALAGNLCRCTGYRSIVDACKKMLDPEAQALYASDPASLESRGEEFHHGGQRYLAPLTLTALLEARAQFPEAVLLAGGTDLGLRVSKDREQWPLVISTAAIAEIGRVAQTADTLEIGGGATYTEALPYLDKHFPAFGALVRRIGSRQIRNLGTFAGNLATASPIGDTLPCLIALGASVTLRSSKAVRTLPVEDFITGYRKTTLAKNEIIASINIPLLPAGAHFAAYKLSKRFDQDISTVVAAFTLTLRDANVGSLRAVYGGMAAQPARARHVEDALAGRPWTARPINEIDQLIAEDFSPMSDHRGGAAYRLRAAAALVRRFQIETTMTSAPTRIEEL